MYDKYHLTTLSTIKHFGIDSGHTTVFELFFREPGPDNEPIKTAYIKPKVFNEIVRATIKQILDFHGDKNIRIKKIQVLGDDPNLPEIVNVEPRCPLVRVIGEGLDPIIFESALLNVVQREIIYQTRLLEILKDREIMDVFKRISDFGFRRAPGIDSANRFAELAVKFGLTSSNMNLFNKYPDKVIGTLPHAFIQYVSTIDADSTDIDRLIRSEVHVWIQLLKEGLTNVILPDAHNFKKVVSSIVKSISTYNSLIKGFIVRIDSGDIIDNIRFVAQLSENYKLNIKCIISGDLNYRKLKRYASLIKKEKLDKYIYGAAIGTQVVSNFKPLSIVYKLVQVDDKPITKFASSKGYDPGPQQVYVDQSGKVIKRNPLSLEESQNVNDVYTLIRRTFRKFATIAEF